MSKAVKMDEVQVEVKAGTYPNLDDIIGEDEGPTLLLPCIICRKTFSPEVLQRHSKVCEKNANKKRKTFDSFKQRVQGTDLAEFLPYSSLQKRTGFSEKPPSPNKKASSHWKEKHEAFVSAIRAARGEGPDAGIGSGDSRAPLRPPDHEQCPYCERHFGKKAFDRHQEWCREQHSRQPPVTASSQAKERLEARIKYRAPPIKSKRALTREKYSPLVQRKRQPSPSSNSNFSSNSTTGSASSSAGSSRHTPQSQQEQSNRLSRSGNSSSGRTIPKDSISAVGFNRGITGRTSLRASQRSMQRPSSPVKHTPTGGKIPASPSNQSSIDEIHGGNHDSIVTSTSIKTSQAKNHTVKQQHSKVDNQKMKVEKNYSYPSTAAPSSPTMQINISPREHKENSKCNKSSKNEQLWSGSRQEEPYDPYASAERQMMELLRSDSTCNVGKRQKSPSPAPSISPMPSPSLSPKPSPLEASPTSAFSRYAKEFENPTESPAGIEVAMEKKSQTSALKEASREKEGQMLHKVTSSSLENHVASDDSDMQLRQSNVSVSKFSGPAEAPSPTKPEPPPRSNRRLASLPLSQNLESLVVSGISITRPQVQMSRAVDPVPNNIATTEDCDFDIRPKTYNVDGHPSKDRQAQGNWFNDNDEPTRNFQLPSILDVAGGGKAEVLNLDHRVNTESRRETRESREIREITEQEPSISDIDNLLEEVVRMQRSVSMLSETDLGNNKNAFLPTNQSSARSRRNRAGKMHIEDFLFPAELLGRENNNFRTTEESSDSSSTVFGSTKSRRTSCKGRRLIEDMLFPSGMDFNANSDNSNEDTDVVVSANALMVSCLSPEGFSSKLDSYASTYPSSPVALTSKAPVVDNDNDGLPRPKPMSLSSHSSSQNGCNEENDKERTLVPTNPPQPPNQSRQSASSRLSADSAYSSLNRRSPVPQARRQATAGPQEVHRHGAESPQSILSQSMTQSLVLSSSGSESSLPPLSASQPTKRGGRSKQECDTPLSDITSATTPLLPKLSKFCHQCGTKFLISVAKFCHECGAARLELC